MEDSHDKLSVTDYLLDLSERCLAVPVMYGVSQLDYDELRVIATQFGSVSV